jgi:ABC-2 type transport system permease protein
MTWTVVAKKDFEDAVRAKTLWALVIFFTLAIAVSTWFFGSVRAAGEGVPGESLIISLLIPVSFLLPAMGIMVGYKAIIGERDTGSIKLLLSLPHKRRDVLVGKFLGRAAVVSVAVVLSCLLGAVVFGVFANTFPVAAYLQFLLLTLVIGVVFVGIAVGFSASTKSSTIAIIGGIGLVLLFTFLWDLLTLLVGFLLSEYTGVANATLQDVIGIVIAINPANAYESLLLTLFDTEMGGGFPSAGFYTEPWFAVAVLAFWVLAPLGLGYWRFEHAEL